MKRVFAAVVTAVALVAAPAFAQSPAPIDPAAKAAVQELMTSMRLRETMLASIQQMTQAMPQQMHAMVATQVNGNPKLSAADKAAALAKADKTIPVATSAIQAMMSDPAFMDEMIAGMVPIYARNFTVSEIRELAAFYRTPLGQKMLARMPALMTESMAVSNSMMAPRMNKYLEQVMQAAK